MVKTSCIKKNKQRNEKKTNNVNFKEAVSELVNGKANFENSEKANIDTEKKK
jgi:hypothetical protein